MMHLQGYRPFFILVFCLSSFLPGMGQPTLDPDLKKPAKYENRILRAEKTGEKKFTLPRRFFQNTYTHYNYEFNARTKLDQVLASAKEQHTDKYGELLNFYNYTLETTALQSNELDSIIYKVNAGILLHDLRSNRMDDLYLLMGKAYYFRNTLDTAYMTFQYMNYAFSPKEADGYDKVIGSNANEGGNALKVATPEKRNLVKRALTPPPGRNDALIWLIRTHIACEDMVAAATLIQTLRNDPDLPARLAPELAEVTAYWFYKRSQYDSAAFYLTNALPAATDKQEKARWEYLLGQLYAKAGKPEEAKAAFEACISHTLNPVMEVAARLQANQQTGGITEADWKAASEALEKMARKERYANYRDLIYYTLGQIDTRHNKITEANAHLLKSIYYSPKTSEQRSKSYLLLADNAFTQRQYAQASAYYDSVLTESLNDTLTTEVVERKAGLKELAPYYAIIQRQDSLQALAALPEPERTAFLKKKLRQLRKNEASEEALAGVAVPVNGGLTPNGKAPADLFNPGNGGSNWYFYNKSLKSRGFTEFRNTWGDRPNTDNWRRSSSATQQRIPEEGDQTAQTEEQASPELTLQYLLDGLPLTPEKLKLSNDSTMEAKFLLAQGIQNKLGDYATAAGIYEELLEKFSGNDQEADILYNLAYCYRRLGRGADLTRITQQLSGSFPQSRQAKLITDPKGVEESENAAARNATTTYNEIYNQFIEGKFEEAIASKSKADSLYGKNYWTPQLLYIEAIYEIKSRQDAQATTTLNQIISQFPDHALTAKAENMLDVLKRRSEIEDYLSKLEVEAAPETDSIKEVAIKPAPQNPLAVAKPEASKNIPSAPVALPPKQKPAANNKVQKPVPIEKTVSIFSRNAKQSQFVAVVLKQVDPVYINESRNAFNRYNREKYYNTPMSVVIIAISDEEKIVAIGGLADEEAALQYIKAANELAPKEIIPWLKRDKYYFMPVSQDNMDLLMSTKNLAAYLDFLDKEYPGQFPANKR